MKKSIPNHSAHLGTAQVTAGAMLAVSLAGVLASWVLWPRGPSPTVLPVAEARYFTAAFIAEAEAFRGLQSWLAVATFALGVLVPVFCAAFVLRGGFGVRFRRSGVIAATGSAVVIVAVTLLVQLPLRLVMHARAGAVGLSVQSTTGWIADWLLAAVITLAAAALLAALCAAMIGRLQRMWWLAFWAALVVLVAGWQLLSPVLIEPLFADFEPVGSGQLLSDVERVAERSGVDAGAVFVVDAARRTTGVNAYVSGLGATRRVVLYDNLVHQTPRQQRLATIAHEFGHARHRDLIKGLGWFAFVALVALFAIDRAGRRLVVGKDVWGATPQTAALIVAAIALASAISQPAANALSRAVEARADAFALAVTGRPGVAIELERTLTIRNIARPAPPAGLHWFFGTHPTPIERIGMAEAARKELEGRRGRPRP